MSAYRHCQEGPALSDSSPPPLPVRLSPTVRVLGGQIPSPWISLLAESLGIRLHNKAIKPRQSPYILRWTETVREKRKSPSSGMVAGAANAVPRVCHRRSLGDWFGWFAGVHRWCTWPLRARGWCKRWAISRRCLDAAVALLRRMNRSYRDAIQGKVFALSFIILPCVFCACVGAVQGVGWGGGALPWLSLERRRGTPRGVVIRSLSSRLGFMR
jgi:hypothetical protein